MKNDIAKLQRLCFKTGMTLTNDGERLNAWMIWIVRAIPRWNNEVMPQHIIAFSLYNVKCFICYVDIQIVSGNFKQSCIWQNFPIGELSIRFAIPPVVHFPNIIWSIHVWMESRFEFDVGVVIQFYSSW
ncbi:hypothetical protein ACA910_013695 [Epithemia clementina (nom. ined.)]